MHEKRSETNIPNMAPAINCLARWLLSTRTRGIPQEPQGPFSWLPRWFPRKVGGTSGCLRRRRKTWSSGIAVEAWAPDTRDVQHVLHTTTVVVATTMQDKQVITAATALLSTAVVVAYMVLRRKNSTRQGGKVRSASLLSSVAGVRAWCRRLQALLH